MEEPRSRAYFLFRADAGKIDAATWWPSTLLLVGIFAVLTIAWHLLQPYADHDLNTTPIMAIGILIANIYRLLYGFAVILILISHYNLSAKRWRDIGRPAALAGLLPVLACIAGRMHCRLRSTSSSLLPWSGTSSNSAGCACGRGVDPRRSNCNLTQTTTQGGNDDGL
jgi:uncharacterized membrane protein YhaH (DUF805 family)